MLPIPMAPALLIERAGEGGAVPLPAAVISGEMAPVARALAAAVEPALPRPTSEPVAPIASAFVAGEMDAGDRTECGEEMPVPMTPATPMPMPMPTWDMWSMLTTEPTPEPMPSASEAPCMLRLTEPRPLTLAAPVLSASEAAYEVGIRPGVRPLAILFGLATMLGLRTPLSTEAAVDPLLTPAALEAERASDPARPLASTRPPRARDTSPEACMPLLKPGPMTGYSGSKRGMWCADKVGESTDEPGVGVRASERRLPIIAVPCALGSDTEPPEDDKAEPEAEAVVMAVLLLVCGEGFGSPCAKSAMSGAKIDGRDRGRSAESDKTEEDEDEDEGIGLGPAP